MIAPRLELLAIGDLPQPEEEILAGLVASLRRRFGFGRVDRATLPVDDGWRIPGPDEPTGRGGAGRLASNRVIDHLVARGEAEGQDPHELWTLAVTALDLAADGRDFVFGEATLGGGWALVSLARLGQGDRLRSRLLSAATHELAHLAGLDHCEEPGCVMHPAVAPGDVDERGAEFCARCGPLLTAR